jgi:glutathione-regulated potassium-efflux system ancillary protein KefF
MMHDILLLLAHPDLAHSRVHAALRKALWRDAGGGALDTAGEGPRWNLRDLYALYPDYCIDVAAEQAALKAARLVVWLHPLHWYGMPPLLKLWVDEVFSYGWAYGPGGTQLAGMRFLPPLVLHGAHHVTADEIDQHVETLVDHLRRWPDWPEIADLMPCIQGDAPEGERPPAEPIDEPLAEAPLAETAR